MSCSTPSEPWAAWLSDDALSIESQALTKALQMSLSNSSPSPSSTSSAGEPFAGRAGPNPITAPIKGKIAKRKSRQKKRTPTTYINTDPENFRAMVQQMTGARFGGDAVGPVIRPEPRRQCFIPRTLDSSACFLDRAEPAGSVGLTPLVELEAEGELGFDVDSFLSFPTVESWAVV